MSDNKYFARASAEELASTLHEQLESWGQYLFRSGMRWRWRRSYQLYYGRHFFKSNNPDEAAIIKTGEKGELAAFHVNHYRNLIKHTLVMTTNEKPSFDTKALNSDTKSIQECKLGNNILDYLMTTKRVLKYPKNAAEMAQIFGKGFLLCLWKPSLGKAVSAETALDEDGNPVIDPETGQPREKIRYSGDIFVTNPSVYDVFVDPNVEEWDKIEYADIRLWENKFTLAEQYPHLAEKIESLPTKNDKDAYQMINSQRFEHSAETAVYYFIHKRTPAMPNGRLLIRCAPDCVLYDGPSPYDEHMPLFRIVPGELFGTTEGYSDAFDLMGIQEAINVLVSTAFTNQQANGVQKLWVPEGSDISVSMLSKGLAVIRGKPGMEPKPLQLTATAQEIFQFIPMLQKFMETTSGINSVARGDLDALGKNASGVAMAYVQSMAALYTSAFQQSWVNLLEDFGSFALWLYQKFGDYDTEIAIAGKRNRSQVKEFNKKDIQNIRRVSVNVGNAFSKTVAGRIAVAEMLLNKEGMIQTPQEFLQVLETGKLEPLVEGAEAELDLIRKENELMLEGHTMQAIVGDKHLLHMQEHKCLLSDPDIRVRQAQGDPDAIAVVQAVTAHIQEHVNLYQTQAPIWSMISGEPPPPPPMGMPPMGPPGPGGPPPSGPSGPGPKGGMAEALAPPGTVPEIPNLPPQLQPQGPPQGP